MKNLIAIASIALIAIAPLAAQHATASSSHNKAGSPSGAAQVPISSPEPITMIALAGGAAAAGGLASRRRKNK
ncbi:MAG: PEP-CTERM sorting domain-containing protein [Planctomycetota bacterium]